MPSILLSDNGVSSGSAGLKQTAGNDGVLILQTTTSGGTATAGLTINNAQEVAVPAGFSVAAGATENGIIVGGRSDNTSAYRNHMLFYRGNKTGSGIGFGTYGGGSNDATSLVWSNTSAGEGGSLNVNGIGLGSTNAPTSGIGIKFPASQSASTDANTLDDYEEGVFSPTLTCGGGSVTLGTGYTQLSYTKTGRVVTVTGQLTIGSVSSPTGTLTLGNLPFAMANIGEPGKCRPSIHFYGNGAGAPAASYFPAFIAFATASTSGVIVATYNATFDDTIANWMAVGSDVFVNFSYVTNT